MTEYETGILDWSNVAEEIGSVGRSRIDAVGSWLLQAFLNDLPDMCPYASVDEALVEPR